MQTAKHFSFYNDKNQNIVTSTKSK